MYKKIYKTMKIMSAVILVIMAILILTVFYTAIGINNADMRLFLPVTVGTAVSALLIFGLSIIFAKNLTADIVKPIENLGINLDINDDVYPELVPVLKRIYGQSAEISHQMERVNRQRLRLQTVGENMNEALIVLDDHSEIISANNAAVSLFGGKELKHRLFSEATDNEELISCLRLSLDGKKTSVVYKVSERGYRVFFSPVYEKEEVSGVVILAVDISEEMKTAEIRREFSANVSHELKTPLTTILGYSQLINNGIAKEEDVKSFTQKIEHESARMIVLIDDIIKLSKLDEKAERDEFVSVNIRRCAEEAVDLLSDKASQKGVHVNVVGGELTVDGNPGQINEMIYNLCDNAIKYNKDNGEVTVNITETGFEVSDTGIGIPEEMKERVFERFFRVDKSRSKKVSGTGLGLSIVKHIALCHDAQISLESIPGEGSKFTVSFPMK